jgi:hypothetical protein
MGGIVNPMITASKEDVLEMAGRYAWLQTFWIVRV